MSMIMNHDITSLMGQRIMQKNTLAMKRSLEKLSTGMRTKIADIDNTAGLAISETMRSRIFGMDKALYNSQDGISLIQTANGALDQTQGMLRRMRELSVQAANDVLTQQDRSYIQVEINEIRDQISLIAKTTQFNRKNILSGDNAVLWSSSDSQVKAVIKGGLRSIDQFGQKYAVDGNFKIRVSAEAGKAEVQKSDILRIRQTEDQHGVITNKSVYITEGITDIDVDSVPAGTYSLVLEGGESPDPLITGSYGIGGVFIESTNTTTFSTTNSPVNKITISTDDGVEIWSTRGANIFGRDDADAATQTAFFNGGTDSNGQKWAGVLKEIKQEASRKGITITGNDITSLSVRKKGSNPTGLKISYEGGGSGNSPVSEVSTMNTDFALVDDVLTAGSTDALTHNASILFEVKNVDAVNGNVTLSARADILSHGGATSYASMDNIMISDGGTVNIGALLGDPSSAVSIGLKDDTIKYIQDGAKFVVYAAAKADQSSLSFNVTGSSNVSDSGGWSSGPFNNQMISYALDHGIITDNEFRLGSYFVNSEDGEVMHGSLNISTNNALSDAPDRLLQVPAIPLASVTVSYQDTVARGTTKLRDIDKFWDSNGTFMLEQPKELTFTQGDGKQAKVMLYAGDSLDDVTRKMNHAIADGLGQAKYVDDATKFVTFVEGGTVGTEAVEGTIVIRSALAGERGKITLSGNEDVLNALSLNTIQEAAENKYSVSVVDAHDNSVIASSVNITGNRLVGVIHRNIDVEFDPMMGINAAWSNDTQNFVYSTSDISESILHLADNTTVFQTGASEGDDVLLNIGDMSASALGLDGVNVMSRERASHSIALIDAAIDKVSTQQAGLGAAQNRLEHHINNLTKETEALTDANSHIRDTDYQKEILEYAKMQILMQSNTAMLAQSNEMQRSSILGLLR